VSEPVRLSVEALAAIRSEAARTYPHEACGALLGPGDGDVRAAIALPNAENEKPRVRFSVSPQDYLAVQDQADARGLKLLGFWHSHPDHPARPSETDRRFAWEGLLTLVIAVEAGVPAALTAWEIPGPGLPFRERPLAVAGKR
jgi:proteasome lid subunit RPN8/RPN11